MGASTGCKTRLEIESGLESLKLGMGLGSHHQCGGTMKSRGLRGPLFSSRWTGIAALVSVVLALGILFKLQSLIPELNLEAPAAGSSDGPGSKPLVKNKVAFLFLVRHQMPLDFVWQHFFQEAADEEYTVYIHARPSFVYTKNNTKCSAFIDRQLKKPVVVEWGEASMLQAERLLLKEALEDPLNQRFILLSDSCVPLFNFRYVYNYVMFSKKSFVDSFTDPRDYQYNYKMAPAILKAKWRKGSQWFVLIRKHAVAVVEDTTVFPVFQEYCKKMALPEFTEITKNNRNHNCIPDEHYLQTLLAVDPVLVHPLLVHNMQQENLQTVGGPERDSRWKAKMRKLETEIEQRGVTYSQWKSTHQHTMDRRGWHPITFDAAKTTLQAIIDIQDIKEIHFVAASRRERCGLGRRELPCYLFARKFTRGAGVRLLELAPEYEHRVLPF